MENIIDFIKINYKWIFSGIGVVFLTFIFKKRKNISMKLTQKSGSNSVNTQIGNINNKKDE